MGAPLYGQSFSLAERSQRGLNAPTYGGGEAGEATRARGFLSYYEVSALTLYTYLFARISNIFYLPFMTDMREDSEEGLDCSRR